MNKFRREVFEVFHPAPGFAEYYSAAFSNFKSSRKFLSLEIAFPNRGNRVGAGEMRKEKATLKGGFFGSNNSQALAAAGLVLVLAAIFFRLRYL